MADCPTGKMTFKDIIVKRLDKEDFKHQLNFSMLIKMKGVGHSQQKDILFTKEVERSNRKYNTSIYSQLLQLQFTISVNYVWAIDRKVNEIVFTMHSGYMIFR